MKGRSTTRIQNHYHDLLADVVGCIACRKDGGFTDYVSIHHIDGRTKPHAHWTVLPLCGPHHQDMGIHGFIAVHPWKARFEKKYGRQMDLLRECVVMLDEGGFVVPDEAIEAAGIKKECPTSVSADSGVAHNSKGV